MVLNMRITAWLAACISTLSISPSVCGEGASQTSPDLALPETSRVASEESRFQNFALRMRDGTISVQPSGISWKVDWVKQAKYCEHLRLSLGSSVSGWRFPSPSYSTDDKGASKHLSKVLETYTGKCATSSWNRHRTGILKEDARVRAKQANSFEEKIWYFYPKGWVVQDIFAGSTSGYEYAAFDDNGCPEDTLNDTETGGASFAGNNRANKSAFLIEVDGEPIIGVYGKTDIDIATSPPIAAGNYFLFAHGLQENIYKYFALEKPNDPVVAEGGQARMHGDEFNPYACFLAVKP
jgi:hypothetical protein